MASTQNKVLFVAPMPPPFAGVSQVSSALLEGVSRSEFSVELIDFSKRKNVRVQTFAVGFYSYLFAVRIWLQLVRKLLSIRPGIVYLASSYDWSFLRNIILMGTAKLFRAKVVCHFHGRWHGPLFDLPAFLREPILHIGSLTYDKIIFLTEGLKASLSPSMGARKGIVIHNFVDPEEFHSSVGLTADPLRIIFVGRLSDDKGIFDLIDAIALLVDKGVSVTVDVLGVAETEGDEKRVRAYALQKRLIRQVIFHGSVVGTEKARLLASASLLVLPSRLETFAIVLLEAFASGLPVVAARVGAVPEVVADGINGVLVNAGDVNDLARGIERLADSSELRKTMARTNRALAETTYSQRLAVDRLLTLFRSM